MQNLKIEPFNDGIGGLSLYNFRFFNYLQSPVFGKASEKNLCNQYVVRWDSKNIIMYFQTSEEHVFGFVKYLKINRFGLVTDQFHNLFPNNADITYFWRSFSRLITKELGKFVVATIAFSPDNRQIFPRDFYSLPNFSKKYMWSSSFLDLSRTEEMLYRSLDGKWRNAHKKAEKTDLIVKELNKPQHFSSFLDDYVKFQKEKEFNGVGLKTIKNLFFAQKSNPNNTVSLYGAFEKDKNAVSYLVTIKSFDTVTYFLATNSERGRLTNANYLILWQAILRSKEQGAKYFDLGGMTERTPKGIMRFKKRLNGFCYSDKGFILFLYPGFTFGFIE